MRYLNIMIEYDAFAEDCVFVFVFRHLRPVLSLVLVVQKFMKLLSSEKRDKILELARRNQPPSPVP